MKNLLNKILSGKSRIAALHDIFMAAISFVLSLYLRLGENFSDSFDFILEGTILFTLVCAVVFQLMGLYKGVWRYASTQDLIAIGKAVTLAILIFMPSMFIINRLEGVPRSMVVINWFVLVALLGGPRFLYRIIKDKNADFIFVSFSHDSRIPVILAGINSHSEAFLKQASSKTNFNYNVVAIVDNDKAKIGRRIYNKTVMGRVDELAAVIRKLRGKAKSPQKVLISPEYLDGEDLQKLMEAANKMGLTVARLPRLTEFREGESSEAVSPIAVEDLLGRAQSALNKKMMSELVNNKTVLITGAGGSIGSELVRQVAALSPKEIILFENSEFNLYQIDKELDENYQKVKRTPVLGDVRDVGLLESIFKEVKPNVVFHAAAIKHVPLSEQNPIAAIFTNVFGTNNVLETAIKFKAEAAILISTDKAVGPTNIMGASKRAAEILLRMKQQSSGAKTKLITVRFGNVLGSAGSVVPLFKKQLEKGGPLTVTHKDMTRYFMTIREAVELVLMAASIGAKMQDSEKHGVFVLDMGRPVKIKELAEQMIKLAGKTPDVDIKIEYTGIRPGEKLYEELFYEVEAPKTTEQCSSVMLSKPMLVDVEKLENKFSDLEKSLKNFNQEKAISILKNIVPEFKN